MLSVQRWLSVASVGCAGGVNKNGAACGYTSMTMKITAPSLQVRF